MDKVHESRTETNHAELNGKPASARESQIPQVKKNGMVNGNARVSDQVSASATATSMACASGDAPDLNSKDRSHWQQMYEFRKNVLGFPEDLARERSDRMIETLREIRTGKYRSYYRRDVPPELTIASQPPTVEEKRRWELLVKTRMRSGGMSLEEADESARTTIERSRLHAAKRRPRIKAVE